MGLNDFTVKSNIPDINSFPDTKWFIDIPVIPDVNFTISLVVSNISLTTNNQ